MHRIIVNLLCLSFLCLNTIFPQVPKLINYQGFINSGGEPLNGSYEIKFSLLDQPTEGTYLWTETQTVSINEGNFNVLLGSEAEFDETLFLGGNLYLEIKIGSETLDPRVQLTSVAYSLLSKNVEFSSIGSEHIIDGAITQTKLSDDINFSIEGPAGGDLGGNFPNPIVQSIQGKSVSNNDPLTGQVLKWDGTQWKPDTDNSGDSSGANITVSSRLLGDGSVSSPLDIAQQGANTGQVLKWDGASWKPSDDISEIGTSGGDITAVYAGKGLINGGVSGDVTLNIGQGSGVLVNDDNIELDNTYTDNRYINENETASVSSAMIIDGQVQSSDIANNSINSSKIIDNSITVNDITPNIISSIENVSVDGGNIDLIGNNGISISATANKTITFSGSGSTGGIGGSGSTNYIPKFSGATTLSNSNMYQTTNGNLGLGTINPVSRLHIVDSDGGSGESFSNADGVIVENAGSSNDYFVFQTATAGGGKSFAISNAGNVGIGADITNLRWKLELGKATEPENYLRILSNEWAGLLFYDASITEKTYCGAISYSFNNNGFYFDTKSRNTNLPITRLRIDDRGYSQFLDENEDIAVEISHTSNNAGVINIFGPNGNSNLMLSSGGNANHGLLEVKNDIGSSKAGIFVSSAGEGIVWGDSKQFRMDHPNQPNTEICYTSIEGPEAAVFIRGSAELQNGKAVIELPEHFGIVASNNNITVNVNALDANSKGLAVIEKSNKKVTVVELFQGKGNYKFDFTVYGTRVGYENYEVIQEKLIFSSNPKISE